MAAPQSGVSPLEAAVRVALAPFKAHAQECLVTLIPQPPDVHDFPCTHSDLHRGELDGGQSRVYFLVRIAIGYGAQDALTRLERGHFEYVIHWRQRLAESSLDHFEKGADGGETRDDVASARPSVGDGDDGP